MTNNERLSRLLAEFMGWEPIPGTDPLKYKCFINPSGDAKGAWKPIRDWNPTENIEQAMECVEKIIPDYYVEICCESPNHWFCCLVANDNDIKRDGLQKTMQEKVHSAVEGTLSLAICKAIEKVLEEE